MKKYLNFIFITMIIHSKKTERELKTKIEKSNSEKKDRKTMYTPYMDVFEDYGAKPVGSKQFEGQNYMAAAPVGQPQTNTSSLIPGGFSGGYTIPGTNDYKFAHLGMAGMGTSNLQNQTTALMNPYANNSGNAMNGNTGPVLGNTAPLSARHLFSLPNLNVDENCDSVQQQALSIANVVLKKEYKQIFSLVSNYLVKNKFLIGMTEVKMTRNLRKKMAGIMQMFGNITTQNVVFSGDYGVSDHDFSDLLTKEDLVEGDDVSQPIIDEHIHKI